MHSGDIKQGMTVFSADGQKLGQVVSSGDGGFVVERGIFFRKSYLCSYEDVAVLEGDQVQLSRDMDYLQLLARHDGVDAHM